MPTVRPRGLRRYFPIEHLRKTHGDHAEGFYEDINDARLSATEAIDGFLNYSSVVLVHT